MARLAIRMPKMSMTMEEGDVGSWMVEVGDEVAVGDVVAEVMTDKVDMEVESTVAGTVVEIVHESGTVKVGEPIGWVEGEDDGGDFGDLLSEPDEPAQPAEPAEQEQPAEPEDSAQPAGSTPDDVPPAVPDDTSDEPPDASDTTQRAPEPEPQPAQDADEAGDAGEDPVDAVDVEDHPEPPTADGPPAAVPRARGLALEHGIDLTAVSGTGTDGLITVADVEALTSSDAPPPTTPPTPQPTAQPTARPAGQPVPAPTAAGGSGRRTVIRRVVARTMSPSALVPQFTVWRDIELDDADTRRHGLSWTTVLLRAYAAALREVPDLLCRWEDDGPTQAGPPSVALAVATDRGLLVPTFREPDERPAADLDEEIRSVVRAAHTGKLDQAYLGVANASLSNLGGMGVDRFQALLTPPQATVLSLGSISRRPVAVPGGIGVALTVQAGLTVDHRVGDGAHGAEVLDRIARRLGGAL